MLRIVYISTLILSLTQLAFSQGQLELYRGNEAYLDGDLDKAKGHYQNSLAENPNSFEGTYNLGSSSYKQQSFEEAITQYQQAAAQTEDKELRAKALHNLGNAYLQGQKLDESIKSYKQALRLNPADNETRYNLAYAQKLKKEQEQQEQEQEQNQDQKNEDQQDQEDKQDKENQDKQDQEDQEKKDQENQEKQDQEDKEEEKQENQEGDENEGEKEEQDEKGQPKPLELTPREAEQMLDAARNEDQKIQMKLRKQKKAKNKNIDKDW